MIGRCIIADIAKSGTPSLAIVGPSPGACKLPTLLAGENISAGDACYIKSDGFVWRSIGTTLNAAAAKVHGFAVVKANAGEPITLMHNIVLNYGASLTPGAPYYLSATVGAIADAASTGGTGIIAFAIDATRVFVMLSRY